MKSYQQSFNHALKVLAWIIGSGAIPALLAYKFQNVYWLGLAPFVNAIGAALVHYSGQDSGQEIPPSAPQG